MYAKLKNKFVMNIRYNNIKKYNLYNIYVLKTILTYIS